MESDEQLNHDWVKSTLGHGEAMCSRCLITNREAAVLGKLNACDVPRHLPPQRVTAMIKPDQIPDAVADSMREFFHTRGDAQKAIAAAPAMAEEIKRLRALNAELVEGLREMRAAVKDVPEMQGRQYVQLGIRVNALITRAEGR